MVTAYIMVKALSGDADRMREAIREIEGVSEVHIVAGDVDLIVKVNVESPGDVKRIAAEQIHDIDGVDTTQTYIAMN